MDLMREMMKLKEKEGDYTARHQNNVYFNAGLLVRALSPGLAPVIDFAAPFHDVGKVGVPDGILRKRGKLTDEERTVMMEHPVLGAELIEKYVLSLNGSSGVSPGDLPAVLAAVRHHHERYDGTGYPDGLRGEEIPLSARIIAVADAFDAMTADRPYKRAVSREGALREITRCAGSQFDPAIAAVFVKVLETGVAAGSAGSMRLKILL